MSPDFLILLVSAAMAAHAAALALKLRVHALPAVLAVLLYTFVGMHSVFLAAMTGDGRLFPGYQINPNLVARWGNALAGTSFPHPLFGLLVLVAHLAVFWPRPDRPRFWRPMPASLVFVGIFLLLNHRTKLGAIQLQRAVGPEHTAFLTIAPLGANEEIRLVFSEGSADDAFVPVRYVHAGEGQPSRPRLFWTRDGQGIILMVRRRKLFAIDIETGDTVGGLPEKRHEWPRQNPVAESLEVQRVLSEHRRAVDGFIRAHGGLYIR